MQAVLVVAFEMHVLQFGRRFIAAHRTADTFKLPVRTAAGTVQTLDVAAVLRGADRRHRSTRTADRASNAALEVHRIGHHAVKGTAGLSRGIVKKNAHGKSRDGHEIEFGKRQIHAGLFNAIPQCVGVLGKSVKRVLCKKRFRLGNVEARIARGNTFVCHRTNRSKDAQKLFPRNVNEAACKEWLFAVQRVLHFFGRPLHLRHRHLGFQARGFVQHRQKLVFGGIDVVFGKQTIEFFQAKHGVSVVADRSASLEKSAWALRHAHAQSCGGLCGKNDGFALTFRLFCRALR